MKIGELYNITNEEGHAVRFYTEAYIKAHNIPIYTKGVHRPCDSGIARRAISTTAKTITIHDVDGKKTGFMYGEKTVFYTQEERLEYKAQREAEIELAHLRRQITLSVQKKVENMDKTQLEALLALLNN